MASVVPPKPSTSGINDGEDEIEYEEIEEEIEVEEEVEVEEEIEEQVEGEDVKEGDEDQIGEDLTPAREENQETATNHILVPLGTGDHKQPGSASQRISISNPPTGIPKIQTSTGGPKISGLSEKEELHVYGERTSRDNDSKAPFYQIGEVNHGKRSPFIGDINAALTMGGASNQKDNAVMPVTAETNHRAAEPVGKIRQISPRMHVPQIRLRDASPSAEFDRDNKKLRIPCQFDSKGWCIKGRSCRFLHLKGDSNSVVKENKGAYKGNFSNSSITAQDNHHNTRISAFGSTLQEMIGKKSDIEHKGPRSTELSHSHSRQPLSFGSSSWNTSALGTQNLLKSVVERHASVSSSLKRSISSVPGSESENLAGNHVFKDTDLDKYKTKISYDWEPSAPFCPSHAITRNLLLKESLRDPVRDSIERPVVKDEQLTFSNSEQGSNAKNVDVPSNGSQEEKLLNSVHVGDTVKDNIFLSIYDNKLNDNPGHKTELKVDGSDKNNEADVDLKGAGQLQSELKAFKYFQSALIEFVKELVKPTWREGLMSKDAHKLIVKKAVDKVLSTLQPHQIPSTAESINLYLSSSKTKLAKLVEGYIDKYGKS
ncbi:protein FRIGIDA-ESSENTIAL 1 [Sesamum alatum]|uniref:Protein FRIGIDA-ESSENTIAL 1 n=1 Tax=Sesamum alatum TaxID=300844 RepID=A0AAE2CZA3_9LAMI|nr:protein FRIGIDA-ESSENTIAL 1 [Sesamum alatum]